MPNSPLDALSAALSATRTVLAGVDPNQWRLPTPCPEWTVADLVDHLVGGTRALAAALHGAPADSSGAAPAGGDRLRAYDDASQELLAAFGADGALAQTVTVPFGTVPAAVALQLRVTELLVHGWDLAVATGQRLEAPESVAQQALDFSRQALPQLPPDRSPFAPPQPAPEGAGALEQLVALLGRSLTR